MTAAENESRTCPTQPSRSGDRITLRQWAVRVVKLLVSLALIGCCFLATGDEEVVYRGWPLPFRIVGYSTWPFTLWKYFSIVALGINLLFVACLLVAIWGPGYIRGPHAARWRAVCYMMAPLLVMAAVTHTIWIGPWLDSRIDRHTCCQSVERRGVQLSTLEEFCDEVLPASWIPENLGERFESIELAGGDGEVLELIAGDPYVDTLHLRDFVMDDKAWEILEELPNLHSLVLAHCQPGTVTAERLSRIDCVQREIIVAASQLPTLSLEGTHDWLVSVDLDQPSVELVFPEGIDAVSCRMLRSQPHCQVTVRDCPSLESLHIDWLESGQQPPPLPPDMARGKLDLRLHRLARLFSLRCRTDIGVSLTGSELPELRTLSGNDLFNPMHLNLQSCDLELARPLETMRVVIRPGDLDRIDVRLSDSSGPLPRPRASDQWHGLYIVGNTETDPPQRFDGDRLVRWMQRTHQALPAGEATLMSIAFTDSLVDWMTGQRQIDRLVALDCEIRNDLQQRLDDHLLAFDTTLTDANE